MMVKTPKSGKSFIAAAKLLFDDGEFLGRLMTHGILVFLLVIWNTGFSAEVSDHLSIVSNEYSWVVQLIGNFIVIVVFGGILTPQLIARAKKVLSK